MNDDDRRMVVGLGLTWLLLTAAAETPAAPLASSLAALLAVSVTFLYGQQAFGAMSALVGR